MRMCIRIAVKPLRKSSVLMPMAPWTSRSPSSVDSTIVSRTLRAAAENTSDVVTHAASACSRYSAGLGPVSVPSRIAGSPASSVKASVRVVSSPQAA